MAWHNAVFARMEKPPRLETLLIEHGEKKNLSKREHWQVSYEKMNVWAMKQSKRIH